MAFDWMRLLPPYWLQNYPTSPEWVAALNEALDRVECGDAKIKHEPGRYKAIVAGLSVWVANFPYAYGSPYQSDIPTVMPRVRTRHRLRSALHGGAYSPLSDHINDALGPTQ